MVHNVNYRFSVLEMYIIRTYKTRVTIFSIISFKNKYMYLKIIYSLHLLFIIAAKKKRYSL